MTHTILGTYNYTSIVICKSQMYKVFKNKNLTSVTTKKSNKMQMTTIL